MKVVFLCRNSCGAIYLANRLAQNKLLSAIILERGNIAQKNKLKRKFKKAKWWEFPVVVLDIVSLFIYSKISSLYMSKRLLRMNGFVQYPQEIPIYKAEDANEKECVLQLKSLQPDILVVLGTSLLKPEVIDIPRKYILNIHGGIVPQYRNVHSDFWAYLYKDYEHIGTTIIYLDKGIDTGDIAIQSTVKIDSHDGLLKIKKKNLELAGHLIIEAIIKGIDGALPRVKQLDAQKGYYRTPRFFDFIRMIFRPE